MTSLVTILLYIKNKPDRELRQKAIKKGEHHMTRKQRKIVDEMLRRPQPTKPQTVEEMRAKFRCHDGSYESACGRADHADDPG